MVNEKNNYVTIVGLFHITDYNDTGKSVHRFCRYGNLYISQCLTMAAAILKTLSRDQNRKILIYRIWFSF